MPEHNTPVLLDLLDGCLKKDRRSQELLYKHFYGYAMNICLRYSKSREEAKEVLNDGFFKILSKLESFDKERPFKTWLARIMINTALDHYRQEVVKERYEAFENEDQVSVDEVAISKLSFDELINMIQQLTPSYRIVFSMHVIDGFSHEEIASALQITVGASKSNLSRARERLREMLSKINIDNYDRVTR